jgi:CHAT domain-containing protein
MLRGQLKGKDTLGGTLNLNTPYYWAAFVPIGDWRPIHSNLSALE